MAWTINCTESALNISGDEAAIRALRDAFNEALAHGSGSVRLFNSGEVAYRIFVAKED